MSKCPCLDNSNSGIEKRMKDKNNELPPELRLNLDSFKVTYGSDIVDT